MYALTTIMFTDDECRIFSTGILGLRVAFTGPGSFRPHDLPAPCDDEEAMRLANGLAQPGDVITRDRIDRAVEMYEYARRICEIESDRGYWLRQVAGTPTHQTDTLIDAIVVARERFIDEIDVVLRLLRTASAEASPKPGRSKWGDEDDEPEFGQVVRLGAEQVGR